MDLSSPVTSVPGIGPSLAGKLGKLGISTVFDLLYHLPFRYEDRSRVVPVKQLRVGDTATLIGQIDGIKNTVTKNGRFIQAGTFSDASGSLTLIFFNQLFLSRILKKGVPVALYGKAAFFGSKLALISPEYEILPSSLPPLSIRGASEEVLSKNTGLLHMARIVPVYPETSGVSSKWLRAKIINLLPQLTAPDIFPPDINLAAGVSPWAESLNRIHFPVSLADINKYHDRLAFDELTLLQLTALLRREKWQHTRLAHTFRIDSAQINQFITSLPFQLTASQEKAIGEILHDLASTEAMNRLLEGDVGSGKTVVAAIAALVAYLNGYQTLFLAPTQILAQQHHQTLSQLFKHLGIDVGLVTGSSQSKSENSQFKIVVGTHALLSDKLQTSNVGLVIIDEQHRFGVTQRALAAKKGSSPHILTMTATPIPRSIALTLYGDLELSVLSEVPTGRLPVKTWVVPENKRVDAYQWIKKQLTPGSQAFIVCPFIDPSETLTSVKSATDEFEKLQKIFSEFKLGLLHGRLKPAEKDDVIKRFRAGDYQILVSTPVVEVGIDIPTAVIMVIEGADRFGLAQLHQLRGRVGRSDIQSYCLLFADKDAQRLTEMQTHYSGLELAEIDLKLRGPGEIYGTAQHGMDQLRVASYTDFGLISRAKQAADSLYPRLKTLPTLRHLLNQDKIDLVQPN